ncbi:MAG: hypothetical protein U0625_08385 [Phycisphaerales bacterium]
MSAPLAPARLRAEILAWMSPPSGDRGGRVAGRQIRRLVEALEHPSAREDAFLSVMAEAELARRLLAARCTIEFETPTARGRHADFRVTAEGASFYLHVKRLGSAGAPDASPPPPEVAALESLARPVAVGVRCAPGADAAERALLVRELAPFIAEASVGDELVVRGEDGRWIGAARILAPVAGAHAVIRSGGDPGWDGAVPRVQHLLRKAYTQFMPGAVNVICVASEGIAGEEAVETALLGSVVERWDRYPPRGARVAHGRADDGFWARGLFAQSAIAAWFPVAHEEHGRLWTRSGEPSERELHAIGVLRRALEAPYSPPPSEGGSPTA